MPKPHGISGKAIGLTGAAVLALVFVVVVWVSVSSKPVTPPTSGDLFPTDPSEIPNIEDAQTGGAMLVTMVDKNDPTRVAGTLRADRFEPIGEGRRRLDNPESWIYLRSGGAVLITADFATMMMPDPNQPPESGTLEGNIEIRSFDRAPPVGAAPDPDAEPNLIARFDEPLEFERRYLRLRSPGHFDITSPQFDFSGTDLTVILNDLRNRVELIDVVKGDRLVIHTDARRERATHPPPPDSSPEQIDTTSTQPIASEQPDQPKGQPQTPPSATTAIATPDEPTRYHILLNDDVIAAVAGSGQANADSLELWAALIDGSLPPGAIRDIAFSQAAHQNPDQAAPAPSPNDQGTDLSPSVAQAQSPAPAPTVTNAKDLTITWSGPMSVRPIDGTTPDELLDDQFALRLNADQGKGVHFSLPERGFTGQATLATYYATRGVVEMQGDETETGVIRLAAEGSGSLLAGSLSADLTTGLLSIDGRGQITSSPSAARDPEKDATIQWKNRARFQLAMLGDAVSDRLSGATFEGTVIAKQGASGLGARAMTATLDPDLPPAGALTKLAMTDGVLSGGNKSLLSGKELVIDFVPSAATATDTGSIEPVRVVSNGQALARTSEAMLRAQTMTATLMRDPGGDIVMRTADASGQVTYRGADRTSASADALSADGVAQTLVLTGPGSKVAQGGSSITGEHITLNNRQRGLLVTGPGTFDHDIALDDKDPDAPVTGHIRTSWGKSMRFDDALGSIVCEGDVRVISTPDAYTRDTLTANRAQIKLTPMPSADPITDPGGRRLLSARMSGYAPAGQAPVPATVESRTYSQADPEMAISVLYLEGAQVLADNQKQTLEVPAPGTLLILDRTQTDASAPVDRNGSVLTGGGPGLTRFTWQGRMVLERETGTSTFTRQVRVDQKSLTTGKIVELTTDELTARFEIGAQEQAQPTRLLGATAAGSVRFVYEGRELLADKAVYDAIADSLFASAIDDRRVTLYDDNRPGGPMSAKTMRWDLSTDRIEINAPTPMQGTTGG